MTVVHDEKDPIVASSFVGSAIVVSTMLINSYSQSMNP